MERISAGFSGPIASAVAAEVTRLTQHPGQLGEGAAYKAAWDRQCEAAGQPSSCQRHIDTFLRELRATALNLRLARQGVRPLARLGTLNTAARVPL